MTADHDKTFFRTFMIVLGLLVAITVLAIIGANIITGMTANDEMRPEQISRVKERTQPVYAVNTDPNATQVAASGDEGGEPMSGEEVFNNVCTACHTSGVAGAPEVSDTGAWEKRLSEQGKDTLYTRAIEGYKSMPAKGGDPSLSEEEMHKAVDYILSEAGAS
ncbi:cytochrome C [Salinisphaera orenii MK-B5]|uniref:Cytochrome C n=1 Tax=Salinisphaera orenii MK-B5 TaxID=856730 RepID=A0A423PF09_9GAMM|nr:c-type cytochrome [Salinisphaera orenii]ROO24211.1 cytochrome C [Salinisphaera orenii MK-B5]